MTRPTTPLDASDLAIWLNEPAREWHEALPIGNGKIGAMVFGGIHQERIALNEDTLWSGEPVVSDGIDRSGYLEAVRKYTMAGDYAAAEEAAQRMQGPYTQCYLPLGDLHIEFDHPGEPTAYKRRLSLDDATATVGYSVNGVSYRRTHLVSAPANVFVTCIEASQPGALSFTAKLLTQLQGSVTRVGQHRLLLSGAAPSHTDPPYIKTGPGIVYDTERGMRFAAVAECRVDDGECHVSDGELVVRSATRVTILVTAATSFVAFDKSPRSSARNPVAIAMANVDKIGPFESIMAEHVADYRRYFSRVTLIIDDCPDSNESDVPTDRRIEAVRNGERDNGLAALLFQYGRYLLISSSRPASSAANLQGIWNEDVRPPWSSNYTLNINLQMNYWLAEPTNLSELASPLFDFIKALAVHGAQVAESYYGCSGWCAGHNSDIWARANPVGDGDGNPAWANWAMGGSWLVQHLWEHYQFTLDETFLADTVYPLTRGVAGFLLSFLGVTDQSLDSNADVASGGTASDRLAICPSTSPENEFVYTDSAGNRLAAPITQSTTFDCSVVQEVMTNTLEAAAVLGIDDEFVRRCRYALSRLPAFAVADDGHLTEYPENDEEYDLGHRHLSHLYAHHPGALITRNRTPQLADAVRKALDRRLANGSGHTGWSRAWLICQLARLGDGEGAYDSVQALIAHSTYPNLLDAHPPFQIDGNFGATAGIAEMLLQSHDGFLDILPALPAAWPTGSIGGLKARGAIEVDIWWRDGSLESVKLRASRSGATHIRYGQCRYKWIHESDAAIELDGQMRPSSDLPKP